MKNNIRDVCSTAEFADVSDFCCISLILDTPDTPGTRGTCVTRGTQNVIFDILAPSALQKYSTCKVYLQI